jgi:Amt family ammonium transporter
MGYDDSLDVVGVHMIGGIAGALLTGVFADTAINAAGADGLLSGGGLTLLGKQLVAVGATLGFSAIASLVLLKVVDATVGLRVTEEDELAGVDITQHSEAGYAFGESGAGAVHPPAPPERSHAPAALPVPRRGEA